MTGNAMDGMIDAPDTFRPGGNGETTRELIERIGSALADLPRCGRIVVVTHGGPIAAARHLLQGSALADIALGIIAPGSIVTCDP